MAVCVRPDNQQKEIEVATMDACLSILQSWASVGQFLCFYGRALCGCDVVIHLLAESGAPPLDFGKPGCTTSEQPIKEKISKSGESSPAN